MRWLKKNLTTLILILAAVVGIGLIAYPTFSDWWNSFHQSRAVASYMDAVTDLDENEYEEILKSAEKYNEKLAKTGILWTMTPAQEKEYQKQLNINGTGIMGYIEIPKINVSLPIYHGTDEAVLQIAIGHLSGTSLPVGGKSTHCIVSGHRGLPSARLFTDLDKIQTGDVFIVSVLDEILTYQVDQIRIVEPKDLYDLEIEPGKDLCTLVTCTPYGINTHRLLVRGSRVENEKNYLDVRITADAIKIEPVYVAPFIAVPVLLLMVIWVLIMTSGHGKQKG